MIYLKLLLIFLRRAVRWASRAGWWKVGPVIALVVLGGIFGVTKLLSSPDVVAPVAIRTVDVRSVSDLASGVGPLTVVGTVSSRSEANVRTEKSGQIIAVYRSLGDTVAAGAIVAIIDNASEQAALTSAQGAVDAATANLAKVQKGTRPEQLAVLESALDGARSGAVSTLLSAYAAVDNALHGTADKRIASPSIQPRLNFYGEPVQTQINAEAARLSAETILQREAAREVSLSSADDLESELSITEGELRSVRQLLDMLIIVSNNGSPKGEVTAADISSYLAALTTTRATINATISSVVGSAQALDSAQKNLEVAKTSAQPEDVAAAEAALTQARGALASARANYEKSIIRAPISGTINSFSLKKGDFVAASTPVLVVANNTALEVIGYLTQDDAKEISVGQRVAFDTGGATGVITKIAPALDPVTKKIEIRIGISDPGRSLVNGQSVLAKITRTQSSLQNAGTITIPISAVKVEADRTTIFTVDASSTLVAHPVTLGTLLGDRVEVVSGLTADMRIVVDARGLREGQKVQAQ